jgi:hypothetical protein
VGEAALNRSIGHLLWAIAQSIEALESKRTHKQFHAPEQVRTM